MFKRWRMLQSDSKGVGWSNEPVTLEFSWNGFTYFPWLFIYHLHHPSDQPAVSFPLLATSWVVGYSSMYLILFNSSYGHRKMFGYGLIVLTFNVVIYNFLSELIRLLHFAFSGPCSV